MHRANRSLVAMSAFSSRAFMAAMIAILLLCGSKAQAGGPRWVSGPPYFNPTGFPIVWYTNQLQYFTDPGDLSSSVNHQAADALVARAAAVWNVPQSSLVLSQGGSLNQHVNGRNSTMGPNGPVLPTDVQTANYQAVPLAVIYDTDGSVIDLLLGQGGSDPSGCLQNGVIESVDSFSPGSKILHALLILNGRCTGPAPELQLQMQYQLMRAFGRVLGLSWSQVNDNVFTQSPTPTNDQALNWPIMHPIDILCGPYTYQCLPQPFTLRPDDISSLTQLYTNAPGAPLGPGKQPTSAHAGAIQGTLNFPDGTGMEGVNVTVRRKENFYDFPEAWQTASSVTGFAWRSKGWTPIAGQDSSPLGSVGAFEWREGYFRIQAIPLLPSQDSQNLIISTESINPLYTGTYSVAAYSGTTIALAGSPVTQEIGNAFPYSDTYVTLTATDAPGTCPSGTDGTEGAPQPVAQSGLWTGTLCEFGHTAWSSVTVKANRTFNLEVTAQDAQGAPTMAKMMPILGVWQASDAPGQLPTVASQVAAFNATVGTTALRVASTAYKTFRFAVSDQRGGGRKDYIYAGRLLYADSVSPINVPASGGVVTISGMGFRPGSTVTVAGQPATVNSTTANTLVVSVPTLQSLGRGRGSWADITVRDPATGATTTMTQAISYGSTTDSLSLVSAPSAKVQTGLRTMTSFAVRAIAPDGFTPIAGEPIVFSAVTGAVTFGSTAVVTNAAGIATTTVTPTAAGTVTLSASGRSGTVTSTFLSAVLPDQIQATSAPSGLLTVGMPAPQVFAVTITAGDGVTPRSGRIVTFSSAQGTASFGACGRTSCTVTTDASGVASTTVTPLAPGPLTLIATSSAGTVNVLATSAAQTIRLLSAPATAAPVGVLTPTSFAVKVLSPDGTTPVAGESVVFAASGGGVQFGACGQATCTVPTDANGIASTPVLPTASGTITLTAASIAGSVTASFTAETHVRTVTANTPVVYVAAGANATWISQVNLSDNTGAIANLPVQWLAQGNIQLPATQSVSNTQGLAQIPMSSQALSAGAQATVTACAWGLVCAKITAQGVSATDWQIAAVSGATQSVTAGQALAAIVLRVTDTPGHPVAGATVRVYQTNQGWAAPCTNLGSCPPAPVYGTSEIEATSDANGLLSVAPLDSLVEAEITKIAITAGPRSLSEITLERHP